MTCTSNPCYDKATMNEAKHDRPAGRKGKRTMNNKEIAQRIVDRMLDTIKTEGTLPWTKPWKNGSEQNIRVIDGYTEVTVPVYVWSRSGKPYQGVNVLILRLFGKPGEYITFNQAKAEGGKVKKGAKSLPIVYWNMIKKETEELDENGEKKIKMIPVLKYYNVFHIDDVEGLKQKHQPDPEVIRIPKWHYEPIEGIDESEYNAAAEAMIADYIKRAKTLQVDRESNSNRAFYSPSQDHVVTPNITQFGDVAEYYSTLFHELGHSTGHASRLNRFSGDDAIAAFGDESYSKEELVAEITAASILSTLGLESGNTFRNSAAYVQHWSEHIKNDPMMFVSAAGKAEKAIAMIMGTAV